MACFLDSQNYFELASLAIHQDTKSVSGITIDNMSMISLFRKEKFHLEI